MFLQQALAKTVRGLDLRILNSELDVLVPQDDLAQLASRGIRGELLFPVPCLLRADPKLLGYYRLLLGFSQKEFYNKSKLARLEVMEAKGELPSRVESELDELCRALVIRASEMANAIGFDRITTDLLDDLTLLTLGPQLRGSRNTRIGKAANEAVFKISDDNSFLQPDRTRRCGFGCVCRFSRPIGFTGWDQIRTRFSKTQMNTDFDVGIGYGTARISRFTLPP